MIEQINITTFPVIARFLILVAPATNVISEPFPWLVSTRSLKTCLALQCVRVVVCSTAFFHESKITFENRLSKSHKNVFPGTF